YVARSEAAWLDGDLEAARHAARTGFELTERNQDAWQMAELAYWRWRAGDAVDAPESEAVLPFVLEMRGCWAEARTAWLQLGCPYEAAMAGTDGDEAAVREAFRTFEEL